jgi:hypothetical protein
VVQILRQADALMEKEARWQDLLLKTAEVFPHGIWLPSRAGAIHFERANYEAGARLLGQARDRLLELEWQRTEGINLVPETRRLIEFQRMACEELARPL